MLKRFRNYLMPALATLLVFVLAASAMAVAGEVAAKRQGPKTESPAPSDDGAEELEKKAETESEEASSGPNHGHCVSYWAHQAKEAGLTGKAKGEFVSMIAGTEGATSAKVEDNGTPDSTCDFQEELNTATAAQAAEASASGTGKGKGKAKGKGQGNSGTDDASD